MKKLLEKPFLIGLLTGLVIFAIFGLFPIPMYDGTLFYDQKMVHFQLESKIALSYFFGIGMEKTMVDGIVASRFELKPIGYVLLTLVHLGLPVLIGIRFKMSNARKRIENSSDE